MTKIKAKELTLEVWRYLAEHPRCSSKVYLPRKLYKKTRRYKNACPLCELFYRGSGFCAGCPLDRAGENCSEMSSAFCNWGIGEDREKHAGRIVEIVSAWEPRRKGMREKDGGSYVDKLLLGLLTIVFVVLKLTGVIAWSWLWALSPIWIPAAFILVVSLVAPLAVLGWRHWSDRKRDDGGGEQKRSEE